jgi:hypothetical protein
MAGVWQASPLKTVQPSYNGDAGNNHPSLRQDMPKVTPVEIRAAVAHSAQEPAEATLAWLNAAPERRRNPPTLGGGGCQVGIHHLIDGARVAKLVDAPGLGPDASDGVGVRVPPRAPQLHFECTSFLNGNLVLSFRLFLRRKSCGSDR